MSRATHTVTNQVPDLGDYNLFLSDVVLRDAVRREAAESYWDVLSQYGHQLGRQEMFRLAHQVNRYKPELEQFDRQGRRLDRVRFHPGWHEFMRIAFAQGMHSSAWAMPGPGAHVARAAAYLMHGQVEAGSLCPTTMTAAAIPLLQKESWFELVSSHLYSRQYDERDEPLAGKQAMMVGMGMTEKQGGSDLRSNLTTAEPLAQGGRGTPYRLRGHKWFFSAPTSDAHLVLAQHDGSFSCFYVPRWLDDGSRNAIYIQRLKDKLGNVSNASAEVEFDDAMGILVAEEGRGIAALVEMAGYTRLDCVLGSAALLRQALVQALHHAHHRQAFGKYLVQQPLMQAVLADLALESEAATVLSLRLARANDKPNALLDQAYRRILTPAAKFWVCKRSIAAIAECLEVWGGNGYVEEGPMARFYREAPVNSVWEGSGNIMCLDVLRAVNRHPELGEALLASLEDHAASEPLLKPRTRRLANRLRSGDSSLEASSRYLARELVLLVQAGLLCQHAPDTVAQAFIRSRLHADSAGAFGIEVPVSASSFLLDRAWLH